MMGDSLPSNRQHGFRPQHSTETATTSIFAIINMLFERHQPLLLIKGDISQERTMTFKKNLPFSQYFINFSFLCINKCTLI